MKQQLVILMLVLCLLLPGCSLMEQLGDHIPTETAFPAPQPPEFTDQQLLLPGLLTLREQRNSDALQVAYARIAEAVADSEDTVDLTDLTLDKEELALVFSCYRNDYPQHFWLDPDYSYTHSGETNQILTVKLEYLLYGSALSTAQADFDRAAEKILNDLDSDMSEYHRELAIHDALIASCDYYNNGGHCYNAYGALVEGQAVCEGYAEAFAYLLRQAGIRCMTVGGTTDGGNHAWTAVCIDGQWYYTDPTWDDPVVADPTPGDPIHHAYFNLTRAQIDEDHIAVSEGIPLPEATATAHNYHVYNGLVADSFDREQLVGLMQEQDQLVLYINGDVDAYTEKLTDDFSDLLRDAQRHDVTGMRYTLCGRELVVTLTLD